jgi:hypothetical protein
MLDGIHEDKIPGSRARAIFGGALDRMDLKNHSSFSPRFWLGKKAAVGAGPTA